MRSVNEYVAIGVVCAASDYVGCVLVVYSERQEIGTFRIETVDMVKSLGNLTVAFFTFWSEFPRTPAYPVFDNFSVFTIGVDYFRTGVFGFRRCNLAVFGRSVCFSALETVLMLDAGFAQTSRIFSALYAINIMLISDIMTPVPAKMPAIFSFFSSNAWHTLGYRFCCGIKSCAGFFAPAQDFKSILIPFVIRSVWQLTCYFSLPTIFAGTTHSSNSSAVRYPVATAASFSVVCSLCAFCAISAAL